MREQLQLMKYSTSELAETTQGKPEGFEAALKNNHLDGQVERSIFRKRVFRLCSLLVRQIRTGIVVQRTSLILPLLMSICF